MKTITPIELLAIAEDYTDDKVRVCIQSLAYQLGKGDKVFAHYWRKRDTKVGVQKWGSEPLADFVGRYEGYGISVIVDLLSDMEIINTDKGMIAGANIVGQARGLAYNDGDDVYITVKGQHLVLSKLEKRGVQPISF